MKLIKRTDYDERLDGLRGTPDIKILSGMRRVGKSRLLAEAAKRIRKTGRRVNVIFADLTKPSAAYSSSATRRRRRSRRS